MDSKTAGKTKKPSFLQAPKADKSKQTPGVVNFMPKEDGKKPRRIGEKRSKSGGGEGKKFAKNYDGERVSKAKVRREKYKISDTVKKLRIILTKLRLKKKNAEEGDEALQPKTELVAEGMELIKDYKGLIYKHDGCRVLQQMIKHGSMEQKGQIIDSIKPYFVQLLLKKYSYRLA